MSRQPPGSSPTGSEPAKIRPRRLRRLTEEEILLWRAVAETVELRQVGSSLPPIAPRPAPLPAEPALPSPAPAPPVPPAGIPRRRPAPLTELDRRSRQKIVRGRIGIERRIDLHGLTQAAAHAALRGFLRQAQADDLRLVLVVTGKGERMRHGEGERGALRRLVPHWLGDLDLRTIVLGFEPAGHAHGGSGALYIRLRRARRPSGS